MPFTLKRLGFASLACTFLFTAGQAYAQSTQSPQKPAATKPATKPAAPAPQPPAQPPAPQPEGIRVELLPTQNDWTKICGHDQTANKDICYTTRDFTQKADQPPVLALAVYDVAGDETRIVRLLLPVGLMLRPGLRYAVDKGAGNEGTFEICLPNGCFAESKIKSPILDQIKKGTTLNISVRNQRNAEVTFAVPLSGFEKAFDGPAIDPKVLEEQQKKFQEELQKRAEEERKRLEAAKQNAAPPPAPPPANK
ncbi:MAG: invasion associated locus B family protein [Beijerinckiaceae bacterium]